MEPYAFTRRVFLLSLGAGVGFALSFMLAHQVPAGAGLWPMFMARLSATALVLLTGRAHWQTPGLADPALRRSALMIGILDAVANSAMYLALQGAPLSSTSVIISLYPVCTVLLAVLIVREVLGRAQCLGLGLAVVAIASIAYAG